jgi:hypothetical protein
MKVIHLLIAILVIVLSQNVCGIEPVLVTDYTIDTSLYIGGVTQMGQIVTGPFTISAITQGSYRTMMASAFRKKNSNQYDIYSFEGKCGSSIIPVVDAPNYSSSVLLSQTMIDDDAGWESIINYTLYTDNGYHSYDFKVFDDSGAELLSDSGRGVYGFDGNSTYVVKYGDYHIKSWRFRTNIMNTSAPSLAKTKVVQTSPMQVFGLSGGDYRVTLSPTNGNQINFQMFDLMGRCLLTKQIDNITSPVSFIIPENSVPKSPFITKVNDGNQSFYKKQIPVR